MALEARDLGAMTLLANSEILARALRSSSGDAALDTLAPRLRATLAQLVEDLAATEARDVVGTVHSCPGLGDNPDALRIAGAVVAALDGNARRAGSIFALADTIDPRPRFCALPHDPREALDVARASASRALGGSDPTLRARYFLRALTGAAIAGDPLAIDFSRAAERAADGAIVPLVLLHRLDTAAAGLLADSRVIETATAFLLARTLDAAEHRRLHHRAAGTPEGDDAALVEALAGRRWPAAAESALGIAFATQDSFVAAAWLHRAILYALAAGRTLSAVRPLAEALLERLEQVRNAPAAFRDHATDLVLAAVLDGGPEALDHDLSDCGAPEFKVYAALVRLVPIDVADAVFLPRSTRVVAADNSPPPSIAPTTPASNTALELDAAARAEAAHDWELAAQQLEAAARRMTDPQQRATTYARAGAIYVERLERRTTALEQYLVAFMATPWDDSIFRPLARLQRELGRYRELAGTFGIAADAVNERGDHGRAADLLYLRLEVERDLMRDARRAEQTRTRAAVRFPRDRRFSRAAAETGEVAEAFALEQTQPGAAEPQHTPSRVNAPRR